MKKVIKFSKKISDISTIKKDFFISNVKYLKNALKINKLYSKQIRRKNCKNCNFKIKNVTFISHNIEYSVCERCQHLNGVYEDTNSFNRKVYLSEAGSNYINSYKKNFNLRVSKIYEPKAKFLKKVLKKNFSIIEIGCGAGQFIKACENRNIKAKGFDINDELIGLGKQYLKVNKIEIVKEENIYEIIKKSNADVCALIHTLEHLQNPNLFIQKLKKTKIKYLFINIPLFSFSSFIENVFKNVYPRHLSADHTHLYSKKSLEYFTKRYNLEILGEWWFGSDISDLFRSMLLSSNFKSKKFIEYFQSYFGEHIDTLQTVLDKKKLSSEVHMVLKL